MYSKLLDLTMNQGKGKAVIEGLKHCSSNLVFIQDSDLEYDPSDIINFIQKMEETDADLIMGSRFISEERSVLNFWHMIGNKAISFIFNLLNNTTFTDIYCCYLCFKKELLLTQKLRTYGFEQHAEILCKVIKKGKKFFEVPTNYNGRTREEGKKIKFYHIFPVLFRIVIERIIP